MLSGGLVMTSFFTFLKKHPIMTALIAIVLALLAIRLPQPTYWNKGVIRILLCGVMLFSLYLISGEKTLSQGDKQIGYTFKHMLGFLIFALVMGLLGAVGKLASGAPERGLFLRLLSLLVLFFFVGQFEELCFRAVLNDAIVYRFRETKGVFALSIVISSLVFGAVHMIGSPLTSALDWAQAVLKTLSSAMTGVALLILYWKTRNVFAIGLVHGLYDFLSEFSLVFGGSENLGAGNYVVQGSDAIIVIITYGVQMLIGLVFVLLIWKKVGKTINFEELRKTW
jgi:CAAX amino terminal protease family.